MSDHPPAFKALRNAIVDELTDDDRRRLAALVGFMHEPQPPLSAPLVRVLSAIATLTPDERSSLSRWCARYLTRWGQVPVAASRRAAPGYER